MPTINPDIALILAADKLSDAIAGIIPKASITEDAIHQLMAIFCTQALAASDAASAQRVLREIAATQPRLTEEQKPALTQRVEDPEAWMDLIETPTTSPPATTKRFDVDFSTNTTSPYITQDDVDSPPSANTRRKRAGTITQDHILHTMGISATKATGHPHQAASQHHFSQLRHDTADTVLDEETGDLLE